MRNMADSRKLVNLNDLIIDKEDAIPCLNIGGSIGDCPTSSQNESDSDSSYGEMAKDAARNMDRKILEARIKKEEKNERIKLARAEKAKESEKMQNKFSKSKNRTGGKSILPDGDNSFVDSSNAVKNDKYKQKAKNNLNRVRNKTGTKITDGNVELPSKLRNITIQQFNIESDHDSEEDTGADTSERIKSFKMRNLNRNIKSDQVDDADSSVSDDAESVPTRHFVSAQKSSAANRRKKSSYLNKRTYKFNQRQGERNNETGDVKEADRSVQVPNTVTPRKHLKEKSCDSDKSQRNNAKTKVSPSSQDKITYQNRNIFKSDDGQSPQSKTVKNKRKKGKNKNPEPSTSSKLHSDNSVLETHKSHGSNFDLDVNKDKIPFNPIEDGSFVVLKEISLLDVEHKIESGSDDGVSFHLDKSPRSSDNEIDWNTVKGYQNKIENPSSQIVISDSDDGLDFNSILLNRRAKPSGDVKQTDVEIKRGSLSSSDFEVEFNACLVQFDKIK